MGFTEMESSLKQKNLYHSFDRKDQSTRGRSFSGMELFSMNDYEMVRRKSGPLVLDDMKISYYVSDSAEFEIEMILSIIRMINWLHKNVLEPYPDKGYHLRSKLAKGIRFTEEMNTYLIESYRHWTSQIKKLSPLIPEKVAGFSDSHDDISIEVVIEHCDDPSCTKCANVMKYFDQS